MNKFIKKGLPLFMAGLISISMLPPPISALAANSVGSVASDVDAATADIVGQDTEQNKHTEYQNSAAGSSSVDTKHTEVYAYLDNGDVLVKIPKVVILSGTPDSNGDYKGLYTVEIQQESDFAGNEKITVVPDETVTLTQKGKTSNDAAIDQTKTEFSYAEAIEGDNNTAIGTVSTDALTAGSWKGVFNFNVSLVSVPVYTYNQMSSAVTNYMNNVTYNANDRSSTEITNYATSTVVPENSKSVGKTLTLPAGTLSITDNGTGVTYTETVSAGPYTFYNITPDDGAYFKVTDINDNILEEGMLKPTGSVHMYNTNAVNVRDIGGWDADGGSVAYNKIIRGGQPNDSSKNEEMKNILNIDAELNLRGYEENMDTQSVFGADVDYLLADITEYSLNSKKANIYSAIKYCFDIVDDGKPLYIHCYAGADRTGTIIALLEGVLGVSESDIEKDYELSNFAFNTTIRVRNGSNWTNMMSLLESQNGSTFADKVASYLVSIGLTMEEINTFRQNMIDGTPSVLVAPTTTEVDVLSSVGYKNGYRISRSSGSNSVQSGYVAVGEDVSDMISVSQGDTLEITGMTFPNSSDGKSVIVFYNDETGSFTANNGNYIFKSSEGTSTVPFDWDGDTLRITFNAPLLIRFCGPCTDTSELSVTITH